MKINKNSMLYSVAVLSVSNILLQILGIIYRVIITRMSGAEGLGVYQLAWPFYTIVSSICISCITLAITKISSANPVGSRNLVRRAEKCFLVLITIVSALTIFFIDFIAVGVFGDIRTKNVIIGILVCLFFTGLENIYKAYFYGVKHIHPPIVSELSEQAIRICAVAFLLWFFKTDDGGTVALLIVCGMIISEIISSVFIRTMFYLKAPRDNGVKVKGMLKIAAPVAVGGLINNLLYAANTILIPQRLVLSGASYQFSIEILGKLFGMVMPLLMLPGVFIGALNTIMMPTVSRAAARGDGWDVKRKIAKTYRVTSSIAFPAVAVLIAIGGELCQELYNQQGLHGYIALMSVSALFVYFEMVNIGLLNGMGMQKHAQAIIVVTGAIEVCFTYFLAAQPRFGIYGYIIGHIVSTFLSMGHGMLLITKKAGIKINLVNWFIIPAISATFVGILCKIFFDGLTAVFPHFAALLGAIGICAFLYVYMLRLDGIRVGKHIDTFIE